MASVIGKGGVPILSEQLMRELLQALSEMRFGQVTLIVQDGRVIQMEKTEKIRLVRGEEAKRA